jgi:hypothetical protein
VGAAEPRPADHQPVSVPGLVELLRQVPDAARRFSVSLDRARDELRIRPELCREFVAAGLPHVGTGDDVLFDPNDLESLSLHLRLPSPRMMMMRCWGRTMRRVARGPVTYRVEAHVRCPAPGHPGPCRYQVRTAHGTVERTATGPSMVAVLRPKLRPRAAAVLPGPVAELLREFEDLTYVRMPKDAAADPALLFGGRIAQCDLAARATVQAARRRGLRARPSFGFIVAAPFSSPHNWAELWIEDQWVPVDPLLARALRSWGVEATDTGGWPVALFHRIAARGPLVRHGELRCPPSLPTKVAT